MSDQPDDDRTVIKPVTHIPTQQVPPPTPAAKPELTNQLSPST